MVGIICPPVEIGLTDLPKSGGAMPPPPSPQSTVSEMQHAKLEFRTFMNFVIILQKKSDEIALFSFLQARELQKTVV